MSDIPYRISPLTMAPYKLFQRPQHSQFQATTFLPTAYTRHLTLLIPTLRFSYRLLPTSVDNTSLAPINSNKLILISIWRIHNVHQLWLISRMLWIWLEKLIGMCEIYSSCVMFSHDHSFCDIAVGFQVFWLIYRLGGHLMIEVE